MKTALILCGMTVYPIILVTLIEMVVDRKDIKKIKIVTKLIKLLVQKRTDKNTREKAADIKKEKKTKKKKQVHTQEKKDKHKKKHQSQRQKSKKHKKK